MERTLRVLNDLERDGVIGRYAIGGAMAAMFYVEPFLTFDLDVFVTLPGQGAGLVSLGPLYEALRARGCREEGETVLIEGTPVQFLVAPDPLVEEALAEAREVTVGVTPTRVLRPEHLAAIMVKTGRDKDRQRLVTFRHEAALDECLLERIVHRHGLAEAWTRWTTE